MSNKKIENQYNQKLKLLNKYNKFYYDKSSPKVSDKVYDELKESILLLENNYEFLKSKESPSINVGFKPSKNFQKIPNSNR